MIFSEDSLNALEVTACTQNNACHQCLAISYQMKAGHWTIFQCSEMTELSAYMELRRSASNKTDNLYSTCEVVIIGS